MRYLSILLSTLCVCGLITVNVSACNVSRPVHPKVHKTKVVQSKPMLKDSIKDFVQENVDFASKQLMGQIDNIEALGTKILYPRTIVNSKVKYVGKADWTVGFFPGCLWEMYALTDKKQWLDWATRFTLPLDTVKHLKWHHDVGFMIGSSFGNGYILTHNPKYKDVVIEAARSLSTRYRPKAKVIQSWNVNKGWQSERKWMCPVIIDNMMNLELLFDAFKYSGDSTFYKIAVNHANTTMKNHFRKDNSCYHVVDYNPETGAVRKKMTAQGYSDESDWARGQAWALYGFTMCYRFTKNPAYLAQAQKVAKFIFTCNKLPKDLIPYWDYDAPNIPNAPRDASAAACTASALLELATYVPQAKADWYRHLAWTILKNLSKSYRAVEGTNGDFILMHSVGSIPHHVEIDVPLVYADYYYLEALKRLEQYANSLPNKASKKVSAKTTKK